MKRLIAALALACCLSPLTACARSENLLDVQVVDLDQGHPLDRIRHAGRDYIEGQPGHRFSVSLRNQTGERVLAVLSVDGVNAISGQTAGSSQGGYVLEPWQQIEISGWRKSYSDIAEFYFTDLPDSYAARTGRPQNVGVIGVAAFRERQPEPIAYSPPPYSRPYSAPNGPAPMIGAQEKSAAADSSAGGNAGRAEAGAPANAPSATAQQIGTGHGQRRYSPVSQTQFERQDSRPNQRVALFYDSYDALLARGVIRPRDYGQQPEPFPIGFVPDPG